VWGLGCRSIDHAPANVVPGDIRRRQQRLAEITELIHVASLLHDDVLDSAATRRGLRALNLAGRVLTTCALYRH
jgi:geranyl diphosphate synthase